MYCLEQPMGWRLRKSREEEAVADIGVSTSVVTLKAVGNGKMPHLF